MPVPRGSKSGKKVPQKGSQSGGKEVSLTPTQKRYLYLFTQEFLTPEEAAERLGVTRRAASKMRRKLVELGAMTPQFRLVPKFEGCLPKTAPKSSSGGRIRLHAEQYHVRVLHGHLSPSYREQVGRTVYMKGHTVRLHRDAIEIHSGSSFFGEDPDAADSQALDYWRRFLLFLSDRVGVLLLKDGSFNITRVKAEYAETGNELAVQCRKEKQNVRVKAVEDGKTWLEFDNSFNMHEAETKHPQTAKEDMARVVQPFFNDLRSQEWIPLSEASRHIADLAYNVHELSHGVRACIDAVTAVAKGLETTNRALQVLLPKPPGEQENSEPEGWVPEYFG